MVRSIELPIVRAILQKKSLLNVFFRDCLQQIQFISSRNISVTCYGGTLADHSLLEKDFYYNLITFSGSLSISHCLTVIRIAVKGDETWNRPHNYRTPITLIPAAVERNFSTTNSLKSLFFFSLSLSSAAAGYINVQLNSLLQWRVNLQQEKPGKPPQWRLIMQTARRVLR